MRAIALADFGSTFTKLTIVEEGTGRRLASASAPTSIESDVMEGYGEALGEALAGLGEGVEITDRLAASSAGGGLRLAAVGLVPELTATAAKQAALNAGARIELVLAGRLEKEDVSLLEAKRPEIILFSGGTDGGQRRQVLENAEALAAASFGCHVIVACNGEIAAAAADLFAEKGHGVEVVENVLPAIDRLHIEPARRAVHEAFIRHVIRGKGLSQTEEFGRTVAMPTPEAVLEATRLLARGEDGKAGIGDVVVVDIGGATTDVHSAVALRPARVGVSHAGLPPLPLTRSVQGDLGMRWSAPGVLDADRAWLEAEAEAWGFGEAALSAACARRHANPDFMPDDGTETRLDRALAVSCLAHAIRRHSGQLSTVYVPNQGANFVQQGLDLREVPLVIGTGGMLVYSPEGENLLTAAFERQSKESLAPKNPAIALDSNYILASAGLLATKDPSAALALLRSEFGQAKAVSPRNACG
jgi:uncharacterized protein (TIGR01319 family)